MLHKIVSVLVYRIIEFSVTDKNSLWFSTASF